MKLVNLAVIYLIFHLWPIKGAIKAPFLPLNIFISAIIRAPRGALDGFD
jgi:hypothetical protein